MFEDTLERIRLLVKDDDIYAVVSRINEELTQSLTKGSDVHVIAEPVGRNTAAAIGLAAVHLAVRDENTPMVVLPSDHFISNVDNFIETLRSAGEIAASGFIVTLGIRPDRPEIGYGYLKLGDERGQALGRSFFSVDRFIEKPNLETAIEYLSSGDYFWNSGIFIFTPKTILAEINRGLPTLYSGLNKIKEAIGTPDYQSILDREYPQLESISMDHGVMERPAAPVNVIKSDFVWNDVGSWQALYELRNGSYDQNANLLPADAVVIDAQGNMIYSKTKRIVTMLGINGLVVVDTPDALLIADMNRSQDVKKMTELLKRSGHGDVC